MTQNKSFIKVGLTGGIGSGKSTVSKMFSDKGICIVDADKISRDVMKIYPEISESIRKVFGDDFFDGSGNLKRRQLGDFIFKNQSYRKQLEDIIIPYIKTEISKRIESCRMSKNKICIVDAPTLIEQGLYKEMDYNILVWVDKDTQIKRVKDRDDMNDEDVQNRIKSQMPLEDKIKYVDFVIDNSGSLEETENEVRRVLNKFIGGL